MRFYREQMRYSSFYRPGSTYYQSKENSSPIPPKTLLIVSLLVCAILLFDAIFVRYNILLNISYIIIQYYKIFFILVLLTIMI